MTSDQLQLILSPLGKGVAQTTSQISAENYACPSREWLEGDFSSALKTDLDRLGASRYVLGKDDCRIFSLYAMALAYLCHNLGTNATSAVSFGMVNYLKAVPNGLPVGHRVNLVVVEDTPVEFTPVFYEPQLAQIVQLTQDELDSVNGYYF